MNIGAIIYLRVNDSGSYTNIEWYYNSSTPLMTGGIVGPITMGTTSPFSEIKTYNLTVVGTWIADGKPYGTPVFIRVDP